MSSSKALGMRAQLRAIDNGELKGMRSHEVALFQRRTEILFQRRALGVATATSLKPLAARVRMYEEMMY